MERYFKVTDVAARLDVSPKVVRACAAVAEMVSEPRVFLPDPELEEPIAARHAGELRRKASNG